MVLLGWLYRCPGTVGGAWNPEHGWGAFPAHPLTPQAWVYEWSPPSWFRKEGDDMNGESAICQLWHHNPEEYLSFTEHVL